ncbi:hypothetical protein KUCAC02_007226, partial [Chaenocephalus aceratus]
SGKVSAENGGLRSEEVRSSTIRRERGASSKASRPSLDIEPAEGGRGVGVGAAAAEDASSVMMSNVSVEKMLLILQASFSSFFVFKGPTVF